MASGSAEATSSRPTDPALPDRLPPQAWLDAPATQAVVGALTATGQPVRFVGGCVRDALLGRPVTDVDLATPLQPEAVTRALEAAGIRAVPTGWTHGTVTAVVNGRPFEITTLRIDVETDGRHAVVAFTDDWQADAARRDFTMNALSAEPNRCVHDYFGGIADAMAGRVRFVGDPMQRLEEDVLRLLRLFRFQAHYGREAPTPEALDACRTFASRLTRLAGERVRNELLKLLAAPDPTAAWRLVCDVGAADVLVGEPGNIDRLAGLVAFPGEGGDPVRRLAALVTGNDAATVALADRLRLTGAEKDRLLAMRRAAGAVAGAMDTAAVRRAAYRDGIEAVRDALFLSWSDAPDDARYGGSVAALTDWSPPVFPLRGRDVLALGVPKGPRVGRLLSTVEDWWISGDFAAGPADCLAELRRLAAADVDNA